MRKPKPLLKLLLFIFCLVLVFCLLNKRKPSYKDAEKLDLDLFSSAYILYDVKEDKVLYCDGNRDRIFPASLTKLMTMDVIIRDQKDLSAKSSYSLEQEVKLEEAHASVAGLVCEKEYSIEDLLYALILPSGADAADALSNLYSSGSFISRMNSRARKLGMFHSRFVNATGLHDKKHYSSLDDLLLLCRDLLKNKTAAEVLSALSYSTEDGIVISSTLSSLGGFDHVTLLGGKTGFTGEAGENIIVYYLYEEHPYLLLLAGAQGNPYEGQTYHFDDVREIWHYLYD